jgi:hypothetical protein
MCSTRNSDISNFNESKDFPSLVEFGQGQLTKDIASNLMMNHSIQCGYQRHAARIFFGAT